MRGASQVGGVAEGGVEDAAHARAGVVPKRFGGLALYPRGAYEGEGGEGEYEKHGGVEQLHDDDRDGQGYCGDAICDSSHRAYPLLVGGHGCTFVPL